jgi:hypothetical protein
MSNTFLESNSRTELASYLKYKVLVFFCIPCESVNLVMILTFLHTVGPGGNPDENGETTLDALIMNGVTAAYSCCIAAFIVA